VSLQHWHSQPCVQSCDAGGLDFLLELVRPIGHRGIIYVSVSEVSVRGFQLVIVLLTKRRTRRGASLSVEMALGRSELH